MSPEMTWRDAIEKVLSESSEALHYKNIAEKIIRDHLRSSSGKTPEQTVCRDLSVAVRDEGDNCPFQRVSAGVYIWKAIMGKAGVIQPSLFSEKARKETSMSGNNEKKTSGGCSFQKTSPERSALTPNTKVLNVIIPFEEALKLNLSLQDCLLKLNTIKMSTKAGKNAAVNLSLHLDAGRVQILKAKK